LAVVKKIGIGIGIFFVIVIVAVAFSVIVISNPAFAQTPTQIIPTWVRNNAGWWGDGLVSDKDFAGGLQFLMKEGLLNTNPIPDEFPSHLKVSSRDWADGTISDQEYLLTLENWIQSYNQKPVELTVPTSGSSYEESSPNNSLGEVLLLDKNEVVTKVKQSGPCGNCLNNSSSSGKIVRSTSSSFLIFKHRM